VSSPTCAEDSIVVVDVTVLDQILAARKRSVPSTLHGDPPSRCAVHLAVLDGAAVAYDPDSAPAGVGGSAVDDADVANNASAGHGCGTRVPATETMYVCGLVVALCTCMTVYLVQKRNETYFQLTKHLFQIDRQVSVSLVARARLM
jgi:hypothetical protein